MYSSLGLSVCHVYVSIGIMNRKRILRVERGTCRAVAVGVYCIEITKSWCFFSEGGGWGDNVNHPIPYLVLLQRGTVYAELTNALDTKF